MNCIGSTLKIGIEMTKTNTKVAILKKTKIATLVCSTYDNILRRLSPPERI